MYDWEIISRLGHGLRTRQPKLGRRINWRPRAEKERLAAAATGPVYGAARYNPAGRRAGGDRKDEAEDDDTIVRSADEPARVVAKRTVQLESRKKEELFTEEEALEEAPRGRFLALVR
jgi:hypothetical protein